MTTTDSDRHEDHFGEFAEELRLLAEAVLERVEPVLRRAAADGRPEWDACTWCPVCAAAALVRGEHHDVLTAIAENGTAIVTVLREALAGVPVDPVMPPDLDHEAPQHDSPAPPAGPDSGPDADDSPETDPGTIGRVSDPSDNSAAADRRPGPAKPTLGATLLGAMTGRTSPRGSRPKAGREQESGSAPGQKSGSAPGHEKASAPGQGSAGAPGRGAATTPGHGRANVSGKDTAGASGQGSAGAAGRSEARGSGQGRAGGQGSAGASGAGRSGYVSIPVQIKR
ncbi:hypothetical protein [Nocardia pseudobrasiliensis]|uniref:Uncharacterized protein n=1 Tax=Nocardia pseudobrasiliensis TaxID=45979 RepID=A0A370I3G1_9NOCA|nr:hypothetical protein [Nocardia pseudobrasiliensis]RDI65288.1 hypothetical protein DFR76_106157 [Nocardia pseudobrasiliensis]